MSEPDMRATTYIDGEQADSQVELAIREVGALLANETRGLIDYRVGDRFVRAQSFTDSDDDPCHILTKVATYASRFSALHSSHEGEPIELQYRVYVDDEKVVFYEFEIVGDI